MGQQNNELTGLEIAITGISCEFPGAKNLKEYWSNLVSGKETVSFFSKEELLKEGLSEELISNPNFVGAKGVIDDIEFFDSEFFDFTPHEAKLCDPQVRLFLQNAWKALEDASIVPSNYKGLISLYASHTSNLLWVAKNLLSDTNDDGFIAGSLNTNFFSTLVSYKLNLKGPSVTVNTACSSSLTAIHMACRSLLTGECDAALAGGVTITLPRKNGYLYQEGMVMSSDGHCRSFDNMASGIVNGDGVGVVVLKRLTDAVRDNDDIYAVIKASAVNNDGDRKVGYTAPSIDGQAEVINAALITAELEPEDISFIECHGTGTNFGDPVEIEALKIAFNSTKKGFCGIGSVKSNMGHLDSASGVAGVIKAALSIRNKCIPPTINFSTSNKNIDFENSPFFVVSELYSLANQENPIRGGVSSFGIGGTNAHVILEEYKQDTSLGNHLPHTLNLSAKSAPALERITDELLDYLQESENINLSNVTNTLNLGRKHFNYRRTITGAHTSDIIKELEKVNSSKVKTNLVKDKLKETVFMFSGQGSQYVNMAVDLYNKENIFREHLDSCFDILDRILDYDFRQVLYPVEHTQPLNEIKEIDKAPIAIFIVEFSLAKLLMSWGIHPTAMIGHSIGEYVAASIAGVFKLEDALRLVVVRGKTMKSLPKGVMMSVPMEQVELLKILPLGISLAADHGESCLVSGDTESIDRFENQMKESRLMCQRLLISHAGHSNQMAGMLGEFKNELLKINFNSPVIPYVSTVTGDWIVPTDAMNPEYWCKHIIQTVQFASGIKKLMSQECCAYYEIGPGNVLCTIAIQYKQKDSTQFITNLLKHPQQQDSDLLYLRNKISNHWLYGGEIDWKSLYDNQKCRNVHLPTYSFDKKDCGAHVPLLNELLNKTLDSSIGSDNKLPIEKWFYIPYWKPSLLELTENKDFKKETCLVLLQTNKNAAKFKDSLRSFYNNVIVAYEGSGYFQKSNTEFEINFNQEQDYKQLFVSMKEKQNLPSRIIHLLNISETEGDCIDVKDEINRSFYSLFFLSKALNEYIDNEFKVVSVSNHMFDISGYNPINPFKSLTLGIAKVASVENPKLSVKCIDFHADNLEGVRMENIVDELEHNSQNDNVHYCQNIRYSQSFEQQALRKKGVDHQLFKENGTYLITGGAGGIGLEISNHLSNSMNLNLVLIGQSELTEKGDINKFLEIGKLDLSNRKKIEGIQKLQCKNNNVIYLQADVSESNDMLKVKEIIESRFGKLDGIIHAAGYSNGKLLLHKTKETVDETFKSKVKGTIVLDKIFAEDKLDFVILFSSLNSIIPAIGLSDYCAANAFQDAFALNKRSSNGIPYHVINWDAWQEVGGAYDASLKMAEALVDGSINSNKINLPLFSSYSCITKKTHLFKGTLKQEDLWVLHEHKINNTSTMPGTGYIEMIASAIRHITEKKSFEIRNMVFVSPLFVEDEKEVHCIFTEGLNEYNFKVISRIEQGKDAWQEHSYGVVIETCMQNSKQLDNDYIKSKFSKLKDVPININSNVQFGKRWSESYKNSEIIDGSKYVDIELPLAYKSDLEQYKVHPALLDVSLSSINTDGFFLPFLYKNVKIFNELPEKIISRVTYAKNNKEGTQFKNYDIEIYNSKGSIIAEFNEFTLVSAESLSKKNDFEATSIVANNYKDLAGEDANLLYKNNSAEDLVNEHLIKGILPSEGCEVFDIVLSNRLPQVICSTHKFKERLRSNSLVKNDADFIKGGVGEFTEKVILPKGKLEELISDLWKSQLGLESINVHENFFDIGAKSVAIIQVTNKLKNILKTDIPITSMYVYPTISELADSFSHKSESLEKEGFSKEENKRIKGVNRLYNRRAKLTQ